MKLVPNEFPSLDLGFRLALIGEGPGEKEEFMGKPFVGASGNILTGALQTLQIPRSACFVGNMCQHLPPNGDLSAFMLDGPEMTHGMAQLKADLDGFQPNACLLMGYWPNKLAGIDLKQVNAKDNDKDDKFTITAFRGTIFECREISSPFFRRKCVATFHPSSLVIGRKPKNIPLFKFDLKRGRDEAENPILTLPERSLEVDLTCSQIIDRLDAISKGDLIAMDIEGGVKSITCVSFATAPDKAFIVNWLDFSDDEKVRLLRAVARVVCDKDIYKILQQSLYDNFVLSYVLKMPIRGVVHDTMLSGWEIFPELPKGLGTQTSLWTREPYYKFERKIQDKRTHYIYCCKDSAVTKEIHLAQKKHMTDGQREHYKFNMSLLPALTYMELKGWRYDHDLAKRKLEDTRLEMADLQTRMTSISGIDINPNCNNGKNSLVNILYNQLGFEPQYKKEGGRKTTTKTADVEALLRLVKTDSSHLIFHILKWRQLEGVRKQLEITGDPDGRVRCEYNLVGTDTGRMSCYESPTESGTNLQTITKKLRVLYLADKGKAIIKCDLEGADGWTVAAHSARLGDTTMLDDYLYHIKPARVIAAMRQDRSVAQISRENLSEFIKSIDIPEWLYFTCKRVQHGSNYGLGKITMSTVILKDSWKVDGNPIYVTAADCEALQRLYLEGRYKGVAMWQQWVIRELFAKRALSCASGHVRPFFGPLGHPDRPDPTTANSAWSHEPQANTTYAINRVVRNLWYDPENYDTRGCLIIEPMHLVHDELVSQVDIDKVEWAVAKMQQWFHNELMIANIPIFIPFDGGYGPSWGETPNKIHT
jgi:uracil-DNA glycosylase family 4